MLKSLPLAGEVPPRLTEAPDSALLIHGTFAGRAADRGDSWWQEGSTAWRALSERLPAGAASGRGYHLIGATDAGLRLGSYNPQTRQSLAGCLFTTWAGWCICVIILLGGYVFMVLAAFFLNPVLESLRIRAEKRLEFLSRPYYWILAPVFNRMLRPRRTSRVSNEAERRTRAVVPR
jgi:hypothetical protein